MSVGKRYGGQGIGSLLIDTHFAWGKDTDSIPNIKLRAREDNERAASHATNAKALP
ncbi:MAG TPA: hypothetical protein VF171_06750 [Trueperaceae bacterium]